MRHDIWLLLTCFYWIDYYTATTTQPSRTQPVHSVYAGHQPCGSPLCIYMHVMNMGAGGKLLPRSIERSKKVEHLGRPADTAVRQGLVGVDGMAHWKGERMAGVKKKIAALFFPSYLSR